MPIWEAIVGGTTYNLSNGSPFAVLDEDVGMAPVRRITDRGPLQDGDSDIDFRLDPLMFSLGLLISASSISEHYTHRGLALRIFRPSKTPILLRCTLDDGNIRQIDVHVSGRLAFASKEARGFTQRCVVPFRAANPLFYDPSGQSQTFGVGAGSTGWVFPLKFPRGFGSSVVDQVRTITYLGTYREFPVITINGPITNPIITNLTTGDKLDFTGTTIIAGVSYTIDCRAGKKTVIDNSGANRIDKLSDDSDLQTFSLESDVEAIGGINDIKVTGTAANATTEVYLQWYTRYIGF